MKAKQEIVYRRKEDKIKTHTPILPPADKKIYKIKDEKDTEEAFETGINRLNPNFWYIFGQEKAHRDIFGMYLNEHCNGLKNLFIRAVLEDPPDYLYLKDQMLKGVLRTKFQNNPNYGIFKIERGKIKVKEMSNREAIRKLRAILIDMQGVYEKEGEKPRLSTFKDEEQSLMTKLNEIQKNFEDLEEVYSEQQRTAVHPQDPHYFSKLQEEKELKEKLYYAPLWD